MQQNPRIKVHTSIAPSNEAVKTDKKIRWRVLPQARGQSAQRKRIARRARAAQRTRTRHTLSERLLRNTAVACALILVAMAITSIDAPWSQKAADGIRQALTMNVELDEQIGGLQFVQRLMPESALVFWNLESGAQTPVSGEIAHEYSAQQPWREYATETDAPVRAAMDEQLKAMGIEPNNWDAAGSQPLKGLRIGVPDKYFGAGLAPDVAAAAEAALPFTSSASARSKAAKRFTVL